MLKNWIAKREIGSGFSDIVYFTFWLFVFYLAIAQAAYLLNFQNLMKTALLIAVLPASVKCYFYNFNSGRDYKQRVAIRRLALHRGQIRPLSGLNTKPSEGDNLPLWIAQQIEGADHWKLFIAPEITSHDLEYVLLETGVWECDTDLLQRLQELDKAVVRACDVSSSSIEALILNNLRFVILKLYAETYKKDIGSTNIEYQVLQNLKEDRATHPSIVTLFERVIGFLEGSYGSNKLRDDEWYDIRNWAVSKARENFYS